LKESPHFKTRKKNPNITVLLKAKQIYIYKAQYLAKAINTHKNLKISLSGKKLNRYIFTNS